MSLWVLCPYRENLVFDKLVSSFFLKKQCLFGLTDDEDRWEKIEKDGGR